MQPVGLKFSNLELPDPPEAAPGGCCCGSRRAPSARRTFDCRGVPAAAPDRPLRPRPPSCARLRQADSSVDDLPEHLLDMHTLSALPLRCQEVLTPRLIPSRCIWLVKAQQREDVHAGLQLDFAGGRPAGARVSTATWASPARPPQICLWGGPSGTGWSCSLHIAHAQQEYNCKFCSRPCISVPLLEKHLREALRVDSRRQRAAHGRVPQARMAQASRPAGVLLKNPSAQQPRGE